MIHDQVYMKLMRLEDLDLDKHDEDYVSVTTKMTCYEEFLNLLEEYFPEYLIEDY